MMFATCYTASVMGKIHRSFDIEIDTFTAVCNVEIWCGSTGFNNNYYIFTTLFVKFLEGWSRKRNYVIHNYVTHDLCTYEDAGS